MKPSNAVLAGLGIGGPTAVLLRWILSLFGVEMPDEAETALGSIVSAVIAYFFRGGKADDAPKPQDAAPPSANSAWFVAIVALLLALLVAPVLHAQERVLTFTADVTSGDGAVTTTLRWDAPGAVGCDASGAWSGPRPPSGEEVVGPLTKPATFNLSCLWPGKSSALVQWDPPTENTDGSPLTDLAGYRLIYGRDPDKMDQTLNIADPAAVEQIVQGLGPGVWYFALYARNSRGAESDRSEIASGELEAAVERAEVIGITVNPVPLRPTNLRVVPVA